MRRILRNRKTGQFYRQGKWMEDASLADNFPNTQAAISLVIRKHLQDVELILQFGAEPSRIYDVSLPLLPTAEDSHGPKS